VIAAAPGLGTAFIAAAAGLAGGFFPAGGDGGDGNQSVKTLTAADGTGQSINLGLGGNPEFRGLAAITAFIFVNRHFVSSLF
jgi:hypothetical protein